MDSLRSIIFCHFVLSTWKCTKTVFGQCSSPEWRRWSSLRRSFRAL